MKKHAVIPAIILATISGCGSTTGPSDPGTGPAVAWFDGLGWTVDIYYPRDSTLSLGAFVTGEAPNDMLLLDDGQLAVVNSTSCSVSFFDPSQPGASTGEVFLDAESNPYSACTDGDRLYVTGLLSASVFVIDLDSLAVTDEFEGLPNASGIAVASGRLFVSCANYPVAGCFGTIVMDPMTGEISDTLATPENTHLLRFFPETGMIHALSTTYDDDGTITIIDPSIPAVTATVTTGGTPGLPCRLGDKFFAGDGWSSTSIFVYDETSGLIETEDAGFGISGIAAMGDTLYMTAFASDIVLVMDAATWTPLDTLQAGDGPQGILIIPE